MKTGKGLIAALALFSVADAAQAENGPLDLNDFSLGMNFYVAESRYEGVDPFLILYPVPQTFEHNLNTDSRFFVRGPNIGLRKVTDNGWTWGGTVGLQDLLVRFQSQ